MDLCERVTLLLCIYYIQATALLCLRFLCPDVNIHSFIFRERGEERVREITVPVLYFARCRSQSPCGKQFDFGRNWARASHIQAEPYKKTNYPSKQTQERKNIDTKICPCSGRHLTTHLFHTRTCNLQSTSLTLVINIRMIQKTDTQMKQQGILGMNKVLPLEVQADDLNFGSNLDTWTDSLGA